MYVQANDQDKAVGSYRQALALIPQADRQALVARRIARAYWARLGYPDAAPADQTSVSKG